MPKIAISYRRADTQQIVGRIRDRLDSRYGRDQVYIDIDNIPVGMDFRSDIDRALHQVDVLLVVVGSQWRGPSNQNPPRIFADDDPVRKEVETALANKIRIVPILIDNAIMPAAEMLPATLQEFSFLNALPLDTGRDFESHIKRLLIALDGILGLPSPEPALPDEQPADSSAIVVLKYLIAPAVLLTLAHYLTVYKLDLKVGYLYVACVIIALPTGFLLSRIEKRGLGWTALMSAGTAVIAVTAMQATGWLIDGASFLPSTTRDWLDAVEVTIGIVGGMFIGSLIDRLLLARRVA
jgi:hypothetical protein